MLDVVATTPSSPLGACRLVTLDMASRWQFGWIRVARPRKKGAVGQLSFIRQTGGGFHAHRWPEKCAQRRISSLPLEQRLSLAEIANYSGEVHEDKTTDSRPHPCRCSAPGARRRRHVVI